MNRSDDKYFGIRNLLNTVFMVGAITGMALYFIVSHDVGIYVMLASMVLKMIESCIRIGSRFLVLPFLLAMSLQAEAQDTYNRLDADGNYSQGGNGQGGMRNPKDSLGSGNQEIPVGLKVWTVDQRFGDVVPAKPDTLSHMFMNSIFTTGLRGEYNTLGNLGSPRINRIFIDRKPNKEFIFGDVYDFFQQPASSFHFTNTLSPITNLSYNTAGNRTNGEDHFTARFASNVNKSLGIGFKIDYLYGRGYYQNLSTSHFGYTVYGSYLGDRYQAHLLFTANHEKAAESGGVTDDNYITHPESFADNYANSEIPTVLSSNWNRNTNQHVFFSHRYSLGFHRKEKMTGEEIKARKFALESKKQSEAEKAKEKARRAAEEAGQKFDEDNYKPEKTYSGRPDGGRIAVDSKQKSDSLLAASDSIEAEEEWVKRVYVPVTSFIHTLQFDSYNRIYQAYESPEGLYADDFLTPSSYTGDSIQDKTRHYSLRNTFAISLLEGFNKWMKTGFKVFAVHELNHFTLPDESANEMVYNQNNVYIGGQLSKTQGSAFHYNATAEIGMAGERAGDLQIDASADVNFRLFGDTIRLAASGFLHRTKPAFYLRHYHSRHFWWDNDGLSSQTHTRIQGTFSLRKTKTTLRVAVDEIENYTYMAMAYAIDEDFNRTGLTASVNQSGSSISLITLQLQQDFAFGPAHLDNVVTFQKSTDSSVLPVPTLNLYTNLYLRFRIARVLKCDFGADLRWFSKYKAPDYLPQVGVFAVQAGESQTEIGNYPVVNVYLNFHLKRARFFIMMSHVNASSGSRDYFFVPHYPLNERITRFGVSWNFLN